ncbi:hypothetical protein FPRO04_14128 [Fusarium proliferatum]|nr:hypothetical protein FPRO04_14128 [Fusarium proliferatum]
MDNSNRMRRQNEPPVHSNPNQRYSLNDPSQQRRSLAGISNDRYRPASLAGPSSSGRGMGAPGNYSNYYSEPSASFSTPNMPGTAIAYGPKYGHDSLQTQGFGGYSTATTIMYNVGQPSTQDTVYDAQQFSSRQPAAMQMMPLDVASSYFGSEAGASAGPSLQQPAQGSSGSANVYQQSNVMNYASNSMPSVSAVPQATNTADVSMRDDYDYAEGALEEKWVSYQRQLGSIFQKIVNGSLESASETLLSVTSWLLSQVADLGLNLDDTNLHADRIQLWNDFNHAWLGLVPLDQSLANASDPFEPLGKALACTHPWIRHVPYTKERGITQIHAAFIKRARVVIFVLTGFSTEEGLFQLELAEVAREVCEERPLVLVACCEVSEKGARQYGFATIIQCPGYFAADLQAFAVLLTSERPATEATPPTGNSPPPPTWSLLKWDYDKDLQKRTLHGKHVCLPNFI